MQTETQATETSVATRAPLLLERGTPVRWLYWLGGYFLYTLFHLVGLPIVIARFVGRLRSGQYRGVAASRFWGGSKPLHAAEWVICVASGLGETRTAVAAAEEIRREYSVPVAALTQLPRMPSALRRDATDFPIGFAPFNSPHSALLFLCRWRPKVILFVEFSGNYHLAFWARVMGVRTALINVNMPETRLRRLQRKPLGRWQFSFLHAFCVQANTHRERLIRLGVCPGRVTTVGVGLQSAAPMSSSTDVARRKWRKLLQVAEDEQLLIAGSTYHEEETQLLEAFRQLQETHPRAVLLLAPRHQNRPGGPASALEALHLDYEKRSLLDRHQRVASIIMLDTVGELREAYAAADLTFVGGSLVTNVGGHTPLEPFAWGLGITIGPYFGQHEAPVYLAERAGVLTICATPESLVATWREKLDDPSERERVRERAFAVLEKAEAVFAQSYDQVTRAQYA